jgi:hypothetical protein
MNFNRKTAAEIAGWYGTTAIVVAYVLVSFKVVSAQGVFFQLLNLTGAIGIMTISLVKKLRQTVVLNLFWAAIAVVALVALALGH